MLRAGFEPATCRVRGDNGNVAGPQQRFCRGRGMRSGADLNRSGAAGGSTPPYQITEPLRPATRQTRQDSNPDLRGWSSPCSRYTTGLRSGRPGSNGPLRAGDPVLFRLSYIRVKHARLESNQRPLPSQSSALSTELRAQEPPAGVEPAPRPYK